MARNHTTICDTSTRGCFEGGNFILQSNIVILSTLNSEADASILNLD